MINPDFNKDPNGLIPAIVQDVQTRKVLMLGYMNAAALAATESSGKVTFFSRSKNRLWTKGEESGNFLMLESVAIDCDLDTYVNSLFKKGINKIAQKVGEEAVETVIEAKDDNDELFLSESSDLLFHYLILLKAKGFGLADVVKVLENRKK